MKTSKKADATQLTDQLWIGGELDRHDHELAVEQLAELATAGVTAIMDCRIEWDDLDWVTEAMPQLDYLSIGVEDAGYFMPDEWFDDGISFALDEISQGRVVLVHCQAGINRGPSMGFLILISQGWDAIDALNLIRQRRPAARASYAEQAIDWWMERTGESRDTVVAQIRRIKAWRKTNNVLRSTEAGDTWMGKLPIT